MNKKSKYIKYSLALAYLDCIWVLESWLACANKRLFYLDDTLWEHVWEALESSSKAGIAMLNNNLGPPTKKYVFDGISVTHHHNIGSWIAAPKTSCSNMKYVTHTYCKPWEIYLPDWVTWLSNMLSSFTYKNLGLRVCTASGIANSNGFNETVRLHPIRRPACQPVSQFLCRPFIAQNSYM